MRHRGSWRLSAIYTSAAVETLESRCLLSTVSTVLRPDHIVIVLEEDRASYAVGDTVNMPYFNQLASTGLVYANYHGVGHPGEKDYLVLYSGSTQGIEDDGNGHTFTTANLASSLNSTLVGTNQYLSFSGYVESLPHDGDTTTRVAGDPNDPTAPPDLYMRNYNPMAEFTDAGHHGSVALTNADVNKTFASFPTTAAGYSTLPTVSYVVPNCLHNTHGSNEQPPYGTDPSAYISLRSSADSWVKDHLDGYLQWAKTHNSLLIVLSGENLTSDTHPVPWLTMIVNGDPRLFVPGENDSYFNHYNLVRTIENMYGLTPLGDTASASAFDVNAGGQLASSAATTLATTTTTVVSSAPASISGRSVTFTATVAPTASNSAVPTGTVTFRDGTATLGTAALNSAGQVTLSLSTLSVGSHSISAVYGGDAVFASSTSPAITQTVSLANDSFANRVALSGTSITTTGSNVGASKETGEPSHAGNVGGKSVWWTWTAPSAGTVTIDTIGSSFDTTLGVYTGTSVSALALVKADDDSGEGNTSKVAFAATAGTTYQIAVDGYGGASGSISLHLNLSTLVGPANDRFASRLTLTGTSVTTTGTNVGASKETGEPSHAGNAGGKSVWWTWTAPSAGTVTIDTIGSSFDTILGVYTGSSVSSLTLLKGDDDSGGGNASKVSFSVTAGTVYQIAVDGYNGASGSIALHVNLSTAAAPANNNFASRLTLSGTSITTTGTNVGASKETGEPSHAGNTGGKSVWWTWTAPAAGTVTIDTIGSSFDTILGIYKGSSVSALTLVKGDDDSGGGTASKVSFAVTAGTVYQIAVDGYNGASGNIALHLALV